jgi:hypothetical protein
MKYHTSIYLFLFWTLCLVVFPMGAWAEEAPENLPAGFRLIGHYQMRSKMKVEDSQVMPVEISPLSYRVYSDGIDIRVYCSSAGEDSYTSYQIYRSDGVGVAKSSGEIEVVAGVQAMCKKGEMLRQISVTRSSLTMVRMPPRSHRVLVTRATAIHVKASAPSSE